MYTHTHRGYTFGKINYSTNKLIKCTQTYPARLQTDAAFVQSSRNCINY